MTTHRNTTRPPALMRQTPSEVVAALCKLTQIALVWLLLSCAEDADPDLEKKKFTSVFDHSDYSAAFYPADFRQTADGGYLVLAERKIHDSNFRGTYLLKVDALGNFVRDMTVEEYANPIADLMDINGEYYFLALDTLGLRGQLVKVDAELADASAVPLSGVGFPSAATVDGTEFLVLSYDHAGRASVVSRHDVAGNTTKGAVSFDIGAGDDVEEPIMSHILRTGRRFPFQVGKVSDALYFFNGFQNYSFSLVFTDMEEESVVGVVQGQQDDGGFSAVVPLSNGKFAAARFDFGKNYFLPDVTLQTNGPSIGAYLEGFALPELVPDAPVKIMRTTIGTRNVLIYASDTRSKQIGLFFYEEGTGKFISSRYLGFSNPFEVNSLIRTADDGMAICGTTWLAGRFPRICLFKLSEDDLKEQAEWQ